MSDAINLLKDWAEMSDFERTIMHCAGKLLNESVLHNRWIGQRAMNEIAQRALDHCGAAQLESIWRLGGIEGLKPHVKPFVDAWVEMRLKAMTPAEREILLGA